MYFGSDGSWRAMGWLLIWGTIAIVLWILAGIILAGYWMYQHVRFV
jgi:hypothetical protein